MKRYLVIFTILAGILAPMGIMATETAAHADTTLTDEPVRGYDQSSTVTQADIDQCNYTKGSWANWVNANKPNLNAANGKTYCVTRAYANAVFPGTSASNGFTIVYISGTVLIYAIVQHGVGNDWYYEVWSHEYTHYWGHVTSAWFGSDHTTMTFTGCLEAAAYMQHRGVSNADCNIAVAEWNHVTFFNALPWEEDWAEMGSWLLGYHPDSLDCCLGYVWPIAPHPTALDTVFFAYHPEIEPAG